MEEDYEEEPVMATSSSPVKEQIDMDDVIWRMYLQLKGEVPIKGARIKVGDPLLTDYGIQLVMKTLTSYLHKGIILSDLSDDDIRKMSFWAGYDLATKLMLEYEKMGSPSPALFDSIVNEVFDNIYATLQRARYGSTAKGLREIVKIEKVRIEEKEKKRGFFFGGGE